MKYYRLYHIKVKLLRSVNSLSNREGIPSFTIEVINDGGDRPRHHSIPLKVRGIKGVMTVTPPPAKELVRRAGLAPLILRGENSGACPRPLLCHCERSVAIPSPKFQIIISAS
jgi:hypothetical protein